MKNFNDAIAAINGLLQLTLRSKSEGNTNPAHTEWTKLRQLAKRLGFPSEFTKKAVEEGVPYVRSKDFLTLLRVRIHNVLNSVMYLQFTAESQSASNSPIKVYNGRYSSDKQDRPQIYNYAMRQ